VVNRPGIFHSQLPRHNDSTVAGHAFVSILRTEPFTTRLLPVPHKSVQSKEPTPFRPLSANGRPLFYITAAFPPSTPTCLHAKIIGPTLSWVTPFSIFLYRRRGQPHPWLGYFSLGTK
jgi:hypothetical protein